MVIGQKSITIINGDMITMIKEIWVHSVDLWKNDRKEFWELWGGFALVSFWMWLTIFVLLPIFGDL